MDNLCHTLVGVAVARAGLRTKTALATVTSAVASNLPDIDVLVFATDVPSVAFRRGITHGAPAQVLLPIAFAGLMWTIARRRARPGDPPPHFGWLVAISYLGVLAHVGMDLLNTYGVRLLSPLSGRWFYGDAVFIIDLWLWFVLGAGVYFARRRLSPRFAQAAVLLAVLYIGGMVLSARAARSLVHDAWVARTGAAPQALMVGPEPASLFRKSIIVDAGDRYFEGTFRWLPRTIAFDDTPTLKNADADGVREAREDPDVRGFLVWSRFPFWEVREAPEGLDVTVRDMRFKDGPGRAGFVGRVVVPR